MIARILDLGFAKCWQHNNHVQLQITSVSPTRMNSREAFKQNDITYATTTHNYFAELHVRLPWWPQPRQWQSFALLLRHHSLSTNASPKRTIKTNTMKAVQYYKSAKSYKNVLINQIRYIQFTSTQT